MARDFRLIWILTKFRDIPEIPELRANGDANLNSFFNKLHQYWWDISYGNLNVQSDVCGWYELPYYYKELFQNENPWILARGGLISKALGLAELNGIKLKEHGGAYDGACVIVNGKTDGGNAGLGMVTTVMGDWPYGQRSWRWCDKCNQLVFGGNPSANTCAKGGPHNFGSTEYLLPHNHASDPDFPAGQQGWRWCKNCGALAYTMERSSPNEQIHLYICPSPNAPSGLHDYSHSGHYAVLHHSQHSQEPEGGPGQTGWRFCWKCGGLFMGGNPGTCPAGEDHDQRVSGKYTLIDAPKIELNLSYSCHEIGHILGFNDGNGIDSAGNWFTYRDPMDIMSAMSVQAFEISEDMSLGRWLSKKLMTYAGPGMNAPNLIRENWIPEARIRSNSFGRQIPLPATITLAALNHPEANGYLAVRIKTSDRIYTAELRNNDGWDKGLAWPVIIIHEQQSPDHWVNLNSSIPPFDSIAYVDRGLVAGEKWEDKGRNISIQIDSITPNGVNAELTVFPGFPGA